MNSSWAIAILLAIPVIILVVIGIALADLVFFAGRKKPLERTEKNRFS